MHLNHLPELYLSKPPVSCSDFFFPMQEWRHNETEPPHRTTIWGCGEISLSGSPCAHIMFSTVTFHCLKDVVDFKSLRKRSPWASRSDGCPAAKLLHGPAKEDLNRTGVWVLKSLWCQDRRDRWAPRDRSNRQLWKTDGLLGRYYAPR